jgi:hypothetical protein
MPSATLSGCRIGAQRLWFGPAQVEDSSDPGGMRVPVLQRSVSDRANQYGIPISARSIG